jgi:hypothetical protein
MLLLLVAGPTSAGYFRNNPLMQNPVIWFPSVECGTGEGFEARWSFAGARFTRAVPNVTMQSGDAVSWLAGLDLRWQACCFGAVADRCIEPIPSDTIPAPALRMFDVNGQEVFRPGHLLEWNAEHVGE